VRRVGALVLACAAACAIASSGGSAATQQARAGVYTGYGFDTCSAPSLGALNAWAASPYRAVGVYIGGVNRACADGNLSASWVASAVSTGWSLLPLYVGLQAPCVSQASLQNISSNATTASSQGVSAADDVAARAAAFGLPSGSPVYFDMEGYKTTDAACTKVVQAFVTGWVGELRAQGYVAGVYGSAASTIRDIASLGGSMPDDVWIANWNGNASVFGDPYVSDSLWPNHQRIHQYKGGHKETYANVTLNIDSNFVDAAVVGGVVPPPPPTPVGFPAGSVGSGDSKATATWPDGAFAEPVVVTLTPVTPTPTPVAYAVRLTVTQPDGTTPVTRFGAPLDVYLVQQGPALAPVFSTDGVTWSALRLLPSSALPAGATAGYTVEPDGSFDVLTLVPGFFGLATDVTPPTQPTGLSGRFSHGALVLGWQPATDNSGTVATYRILLGGAPLVEEPGTAHSAVVHAFHPTGTTVYRVQAVDGAGNAGKPSRPLVVVPTLRPAGVPKPLPHWAWQLFAWQHGTAPARPAAAPRTPPAWYWHWSAWRAAPFRVR
jgi:hypothetical protein